MDGRLLMNMKPNHSPAIAKTTKSYERRRSQLLERRKSQVPVEKAVILLSIGLFVASMISAATDERLPRAGMVATGTSATTTETCVSHVEIQDIGGVIVQQCVSPEEQQSKAVPLHNKHKLSVFDFENSETVMQRTCFNDFDEKCFDNDRFELQQCKSITSVKGRLKHNVKFWKSIGTNNSIISIIEHGYIIPFKTTPSSAFLANNKSARVNSKFVDEAILKLLDNKFVREETKPPFVVNPLTVSTNAKGKKRLVLDLRHVNLHVWKDKVKYEEIKSAMNFFQADSFAYSFDLTSGYHHVDIHESQFKFLGFAWEFKGKMRYFVFTVLPFGLSSAGFVFTKLMRELVKHWRSNAIQIVVYLDDGFGVERDFDTACKHMHIVRNDLVSAGFLCNVEKSVWWPAQVISWLGWLIDFKSCHIFVSERKVSGIAASIKFLLNSRRITARQLAVVAGKIQCTQFVVGGITKLMTKHLHMLIEARKGWDNPISLNDNARNELLFWLDNKIISKGRHFNTRSTASRVVYSDASSHACAGFVVDYDNQICHLGFTETDRQKSSTWRELKAVAVVLSSLMQNLAGHSVKWYSDNQNVVRIIECGSMKPDLHTLALDIYKIAISNKVLLEPVWIPRALNEKADHMSKIVDFDDWTTKNEFFQFMSERWGPFTFDRFADCNNKKTARFNSKYWSPGTSGVDAFAYNWKDHNNWLVPPIHLIPRVIRHIIECKAIGVLIVPRWQSALFWSFIVDKNGEFKSFIKECFEFHDSSNIYQPGLNSNCIFGTNKMKSSVLALRFHCL